MNFSGWGRYPVVDAVEHLPENTASVSNIIQSRNEIICRGMGRSYGDSSLGTNVLSSRRLNHMLAFDPATGTLTCESGVTLSEIIDVFLPRGFFPAITPGTKQITIGGAIASDVHGKNHHKKGCFSECVRSFLLMLPDGSIVSCKKNRNGELFRATCGGMGLTGVILSAEIQLQRVKSAFIRETMRSCRNIDEAMDLFDAYRDATYSVAWIDCLAGGRDRGRSVLMIGEHAETGGFQSRSSGNLSLPITIPGFFLNKRTVSLFNHFYYQANSRFVDGRLVHFDPFFYPLDAIKNWNRMYGKNGFTQYQFVLPLESSLEGMKNILSVISESGRGSFLAVLKLFGDVNDNFLSFPMKGYTLALDFKIDRNLFPFLDELDKMVIDFGGRIYLTKDVRMSRETFRATCPSWESFVNIRKKYGMDQVFHSLQSKRLGL